MLDYGNFIWLVLDFTSCRQWSLCSIWKLKDLMFHELKNSKSRQMKHLKVIKSFFWNLLLRLLLYFLNKKYIIKVLHQDFDLETKIWLEQSKSSNLTSSLFIPCTIFFFIYFLFVYLFICCYYYLFIFIEFLVIQKVETKISSH